MQSSQVMQRGAVSVACECYVVYIGECYVVYHR
jgi:hypothetical protein